VLAEYTSWRVGGKAKQTYLPTDIEDLKQFLKILPNDESIIWIGLGSNLLVRDGGLNATVILTQGALTDLVLQENNIIRAAAGVSCAQLARFSARQSLTGIEFLAGVPGTVGGALAMNAGCFGGETWQHVCLVETMDRAGNIKRRTPNEFSIAYREVKDNLHEWFIAGYFQLKKGDKQTSLNQIRQYLDKRALTQPTNEPSCGSVFRNPPGDYSARLIEASGLKGYQIGGAMISPKHANFIVNLGHATAANIEALINYAAETVYQKQGIRLKQEVHIIGDPK
jgi:UDP-N-acetylmuramate dehydrogenase